MDQQHQQNQQNPIYYWASCGCKIHGKDIKHSYNIAVCRDHNKPIIARTRLCLDCATEYVIPGKRGATVRCEPCKRKHKKLLAKKNSDKQYRKKLAAARKLKKEKQAKLSKVVSSTLQNKHHCFLNFNIYCIGYPNLSNFSHLSNFSNLLF